MVEMKINQIWIDALIETLENNGLFLKTYEYQYKQTIKEGFINEINKWAKMVNVEIEKNERIRDMK